MTAMRMIPPAFGVAGTYPRRGRSSGVERNLAKVEVVSSNLIARSILFLSGKPVERSADVAGRRYRTIQSASSSIASGRKSVQDNDPICRSREGQET